jgi:hypothetical protein
MQSTPVFSHQADAYLSVLAREAGKFEAEAETEPKPVEPFLDEHTLEHFTTRNAQLVSDTAGNFPESPLYPAILVVALIGALIDFLFLIR